MARLERGVKKAVGKSTESKKTGGAQAENKVRKAAKKLT